jgi:hypothetical protein
MRLWVPFPAALKKGKDKKKFMRSEELQQGVIQ